MSAGFYRWSAAAGAEELAAAEAEELVRAPSFEVAAPRATGPLAPLGA